MAKLFSRALVALLFTFPAFLYAAPRVVTLSPANTELAFAAGITPVGVSSYSNYPPEAKNIEEVSTWQGMNLERIVALKPDLVVAWRGGNAERQVNQLTALGIKVIWVDAVTIEQVADALRQLAAWSPKPEQAKQAAQTMLDDYALLKSQYANKPKKRVFLQLVPILCLPVEKVLFSTKFLRYAAEKTSLPVVGFPGRRLAVSRSWHEPPRLLLQPAVRAKL